ncbi:hypothetical protein G3A39_40800 [Paraburkholderia aspalathi]|nr:hypothetical protein [Paraburkholderia aspalathi]
MKIRYGVYVVLAIVGLLVFTAGSVLLLSTYDAVITSLISNYSELKADNNLVSFFEKTFGLSVTILISSVAILIAFISLDISKRQTKFVELQTKFAEQQTEINARHHELQLVTRIMEIKLSAPIYAKDKFHKSAEVLNLVNQIMKAHTNVLNIRYEHSWEDDSSRLDKTETEIAERDKAVELAIAPYCGIISNACKGLHNIIASHNNKAELAATLVRHFGGSLRGPYRWMSDPHGEGSRHYSHLAMRAEKNPLRQNLMALKYATDNLSFTSKFHGPVWLDQGEHSNKIDIIDDLAAEIGTGKITDRDTAVQYLNGNVPLFMYNYHEYYYLTNIIPCYVMLAIDLLNPFKIINNERINSTDNGTVEAQIDAVFIDSITKEAHSMMPNLEWVFDVYGNDLHSKHYEPIDSHDRMSWDYIRTFSTIDEAYLQIDDDDNEKKRRKDSNFKRNFDNRTKTKNLKT